MFCLSAAAAVRRGLQPTADSSAVTRWAPLMSTAVLQCVQLLQPGDSYLQCRYQRLAGPGYKLYFLFPSQAPLSKLGIQTSAQPQRRRKGEFFNADISTQNIWTRH